MNRDAQHDPLIKKALREAWCGLMLGHALASTPLSGGRGAPRVFYGGARSGNMGGPLVKVQRLKAYFPEHRWRYNLVYALSNAPYLPSPALDWLKARRIPMVLNQNGVFYPGWFAGDWKSYNLTMSKAYHRASYVFWQSEFCRRSANRFLGEREGDGEILFNAVDLQHFQPAPHGRDQPFTFLVTGKIGRHLSYRLESTIAGLAVARAAGLDARLRIAGWVEEPSLVHKAAEMHGVSENVILSGSYTQQDAPAVYQACDAYVMTKYLDPCPNTVLEAMACGLPVLYSASGGVPELVGSEAGVGLPVPEDWDRIHLPTAQEIGQGMLSIAQDGDAISRLARTRAVAHFDIAAWISRHRQIFDRLLEERQ